MADFRSAVLFALDRDQGDGLEQAYHTLHTLIDYGVEVSIQGGEITIQDETLHLWTVELRHRSTSVIHESAEDAITALKEAFLLLCEKFTPGYELTSDE